MIRRRVHRHSFLVRLLAGVVPLLLTAGLTSVVVGVHHSGNASAATVTGTGGLFVPWQAPLVNTTTGLGGYSTPLPAGGWRTVTINGAAGLPATGISAVELTVTALNPASSGVLTLQRGTSGPVVTALVYHNGDTGSVSNTDIQAVADDGTIRIQAQTSTDIRLDLQGYYTAGNPAAGGYVPVSPTRLVNTGDGTGLTGKSSLASGSSSVIQASSVAGIPATASAVFVNFQVSSSTAGYLKAYDAGAAPPDTTLNYMPGVTTAIGATVPLSSSGQFTVGVTGGSSIGLVADVLGYFTASASGTGFGDGAFTPAATRLADSNVAPATKIPADGTVTVQVTGVRGVPAAGTGISAVAVNVHIRHAGTATGSATVWPAGGAEPATSVMTYAPAATTSNLITVALSAGGAISLHNVSTDAIGYSIDLQGWYTSLNQVVPSGQTQTQERVTLQGSSPSGAGWVTYQYRVGTTGSFAKVPVADVVTPGTTTSPSGWPVARNSSGTFDAYTWDLGNTVNHGDKLVQVQGCFGTTRTDPAPLCSMPTNVQLASHAFGDSYATTTAGPGSLALLTGDYSVSSTDVSVDSYNGSLSIGRTLTTLAPAAASTTASGVFGPGWTADLTGPGTGAATLSVTDQTASGYVTLTDTDGSASTYQASSDPRVYPISYTGVADAGTDGSVLVKTDATHLTLTDAGGTATTWIASGSGSATTWVVTTVAEAGSNSTSSYTYNSAGLVTRILAPVPAGVTCTNPDTTPGCRSLTLSYTTVAGATRLSGVNLVAYDPATSAMGTVQVAAYEYTTAGLLANAYDPRISPTLATAYTYDSNGRLATLTPPGLVAFTFSYDPAGRLSSVSRPDSANSATAYTTVVYGVPITGAGAPIDMSAAATAAWNQTSDLVATGTAVFGPDHQPASTTPASIGAAEWPYADLHYLDVNGRETNTASYGAGAWQYGATTYDTNGNAFRDISAANRAQAVTTTSDTDTVAAAVSTSAARSDLLAWVTDYDPLDPYEVTDTYGPLHPVVLSDGTTVHARSHTATSYDQGAPIADGYGLPTTVVTSAQTIDGVDRDPVTTTNGYDAINPGDPSGWLMYAPTSSTVVGAAVGGGNLTTVTRYNAAGQTIEKRLPSSSGNDAGSTVTAYYTATGTGSCVSPALAGVVCSTGPAAQPASGNPLPVTTYTYNRYAQPLTTVETAGTTIRTTTMTYDAAQRITNSAVTVTPVAAGGTALPSVSYSYAASTGLATSRATSTASVTTAYDTLGRVTTYTDSTGATSTFGYDISGHVISLNDSNKTSTWVYDSNSEHRGLVTSENIDTSTSPATFTATYNPNGAISTLAYPGGLTATTRYNNQDSATSLAYAKSGSTWMTFTQNVDTQGRIAVQSSPISSQKFGYDSAGRLIAVRDTVLGATSSTCTTRAYIFDADSNRTSIKTYPDDGANPNTGNCTTTTTPITTSSTFDAADRITNTGYTYDTLGRTITVPAGDSKGIANSYTGTATESYYANDMVAGQNQGSTGKNTYTLDPLQNRINSSTTSTTNAKTTNHYSSNGDSPSWTSTSATAWTRNLAGPTGGLVATQTQSGAITLRLTNLHGDVVGTASTTSTAVSNYQESTEYGVPRTPSTAFSTYGYLGAAQRSSNALGGSILMGARLYNTNTGRFLSTDSVQGGSANAYDYANQDPINSSDTTGLCNNKTADCIIRILTTSEAYPTGFLRWLANRGGSTRYINTKAGWRSMRVNGDHCSKSPDTGAFFNFKNACDTHDLGYDLMRYFVIGGDARKQVDSLFGRDARADCANRSQFGARQSCNTTADAYRNAVQLVSKHANYGPP